MKMKFILFFLILLTAEKSLAWGHRGHEIVASIAARLLVEKQGMTYLRPHQFAMGYYTNVPDIIWKNASKETLETEHSLHYLDWSPSQKKVFNTPMNLPESFDEYKKKMGTDFKVLDGESPWRIQQFFNKCVALADNLDFSKQGPLLVCAGILSHYTGDLSQPLHVSDNFDGQLTDQKGIHAYFEDDIVDLLDPELKVEVFKAAMKKYDVMAKTKMTYGQRVRQLISESNAQVAPLLALDKKYGRAMTLKNAQNYKKFTIECLVRGAVTTALVWNEIFSHVKTFDNHKFYFFEGKPEYMQPSFMQGK